MTIDTAPTPASASRPAPAGEWDRYDRIVGWTLMLLLAGLAAGMLAQGTRTSSLADLESHVASGEVRQVEVIGEHLPPGSDGYTMVEVVWRTGVVRQSATVFEAGTERAARRARRSDADRRVVLGTVEDHLHAQEPDLALTQGSRPSSAITIGPLTGPGWVGIGWLALVIGCLAMTGPRTWRASGWAWAWLILLVPPYGVLAFLVLGGPTGLFPPRNPRRPRLTGGWAFLLGLLLGGATNGSA